MELVVFFNAVVEVRELNSAVSFEQRSLDADVDGFMRVEPQVVGARRTQRCRQAFVWCELQFKGISVHANGIETEVRLADVVAEIDGAADFNVNGRIRKSADEIVDRESHDISPFPGKMHCRIVATYILYHIFSFFASVFASNMLY